MQKQWLKERDRYANTKKKEGEERDSESYKLTSDAVKREECAKSCMRNVVKLFD